MRTLLLLLLAQSGPSWEGLLADLQDPSRAVREAALTRLTREGPETPVLLDWLGGGQQRVAHAAHLVLQRRLDRAALPALVALASGERAPAADWAADLLAATAGAHRIELSTLEAGGSERLTRRLDEAVRRHVESNLAAWTAAPSRDRPQLYRVLLAAGDRSARVLEATLDGRRGSALERAHALHALARLRGAETGARLLATLQDPEPRLRWEATLLVERYRPDGWLEALEALLESDRDLSPAVSAVATGAVAERGRVGPRTLERLARDVRHRPPLRAALSAGMLRRFEPERAAPLIDARVRELMRLDPQRPGTGAPAAYFALYAGPLVEPLRALLADSRDPLLRAAAAREPAETLRALRPVIAPGKPLGDRETVRVHVVSALLRGCGAPDSDRVAFAASLLPGNGGGLGSLSLRALEDLDAETWSALRPRVKASLRSAAESVRLAAAALLWPDPDAQGVCADALYDGDPEAARRVADLAGARCPVAADAPVARRRSAALAWGNALSGGGAGKDRG